jgi:hypothetical protein
MQGGNLLILPTVGIDAFVPKVTLRINPAHARYPRPRLNDSPR